MKTQIFELLRAYLPKSLVQLIPARLKKLARDYVYSGHIDTQQEVHPCLPNHTIIQTIAQLEEKLLELDEAHKVSDDALRAAFQTFSMDFSKDMTADPYSEEYRRKQFEIYTLIAGKTYGVQNEATHFDVESSASYPFPYNSKSFATVGNHLISIGFLIKTMGLSPNARILEFGPGWGNTTECLARMGYSVTAVDIEQNFVDLIETLTCVKQTGTTGTTNS